MNINKPALYFIFSFPAVMLFIAPIFEFPYGFYTFLRIIILLSSALMIYVCYSYSKGIDLICMIFIVILILYNPLIPVKLSREIWTPINFMTSGVYIWALIRIKKAIMKL